MYLSNICIMRISLFLSLDDNIKGALNTANNLINRANDKENNGHNHGRI